MPGPGMGDIKRLLGRFCLLPALLLVVTPDSAVAEAWTAADTMSFIFAAGWCSKEEGLMTREASIRMASDLTRWMEREYGYSREQLVRIAKEKDFVSRWNGVINSYGGCRGLLNEVYRKTGYR